jgi:putative peptide zinc metalloprotease protein
MNLSEALDAALPEIPRGRLTRVRPPCIDPALIVREDTLDGEAIVGAFQRSNGNYFRFSPLQWQLASLFDGVRTYDETASLFNEQTGAQLTPDEARLFAQNMDEADFWYQSPQEKNIALHEKLTAQRHRRAKRKSKINMAHISFSAWDPDRYLTWLDARVGTFVYSRWTVLAAVLLFFFESLIFVGQWHVIGPDIPLFYNFTRKSFFDLLQFWLLFLFLGFFHETAHGLTCKHYGGEVHRMGLMLIYLTPAFFVDITETWISATKLQRLATIIAGIWIEMIFCGIAMAVWTNTQPGQWAHDFSYEIILLTGLAVVVVNLNPLIKLDGYYFLTEVIGIPDLKERSTAFLSGWFQSRVLRLPVDVPVVSRRRVPLFVFYALISGAYSYILLCFVIRFTYNIASNWMAEFALLPAGALAFAVFRSRLRSLASVCARCWRQTVAAKLRLGPLPILVLVTLAVLIFVPIWRDRENALFVVEPSQSATLHAVSAGWVDAVFVREGEHVHVGQPLLKVRSPIIDSARAGAAAQSDAARYEAFDAEVSRRSIGTAAAAQHEAIRSKHLAADMQSLLLLRAPADGTVLTYDPGALLHQDVSSGQSLLSLAVAGPQIARVFIPASALAHIPRKAEVAFALPGSFSILRLPLPPLQGEAVMLPPGLQAAQDYKGIKSATFFYARILLPDQEGDLPIGISGEAKIFGARRSLFDRCATVLSNLFRAHIW